MGERLVAADASPLIGMASARAFDVLRRLLERGWGSPRVYPTTPSERSIGADHGPDHPSGLRQRCCAGGRRRWDAVARSGGGARAAVAAGARTGLLPARPDGSARLARGFFRGGARGGTRRQAFRAAGRADGRDVRPGRGGGRIVRAGRRLVLSRSGGRRRPDTGPRQPRRLRRSRQAGRVRGERAPPHFLRGEPDAYGIQRVPGGGEAPAQGRGVRSGAVRNPLRPGVLREVHAARHLLRRRTVWRGQARPEPGRHAHRLRGRRALA